MAFVITSISGVPDYSTNNSVNTSTPGGFPTTVWNVTGKYPDGPTGSFVPVTFQIPRRVGPYKVPLSLLGTFTFDPKIWITKSYVVSCILPARGGQLAKSMVLVSDPIPAPIAGVNVVVPSFNLLKPDFTKGLPRLPFGWAGDFTWTITMADNPGKWSWTVKYSCCLDMHTYRHDINSHNRHMPHPHPSRDVLDVLRRNLRPHHSPQPHNPVPR